MVMTSMDQIYSEETTARLIGRAGSLGYRVASINPTRATITIEPVAPYSLPVAQDTDGSWVTQTAGHGRVHADRLEHVVDGYQRALALINLLEALNVADLQPYQAN